MTQKIQYGQPTLRTYACSQQDIHYNFQQLDEFMELMDYPASPTNKEIAEDILTQDPPRGSVRFQLTSVFNGGTKLAAAKVLESNGADLDPGEAFEIFDGIDRWIADAVGTEKGIARQRRQADGTLAWEADTMGGLVQGVASDNYTVKADAADVSPDFLDEKIANLDTYDSMTHQLVSFEVVDSGGGDLKIQLFTDKASGTDNYTVKVNADDTTPQFLFDSFNDPAGATYDATLHSLVEFAVVVDGGERTVRAYTFKDRESGKVRTDATDTLDYLHQQWVNTATYSATRDDLAYFQLVTGQERCFVRDPRVSNGVGDTAEFLADQFVDLTVTAFDSDLHVPVKVVKETVGADTDLKLYVAKSAIQGSVGTVEVRIYDTVPGRTADEPGEGEGTLVTLDGDGHYLDGDTVVLLNDSWSPVVPPNETGMTELVLQAYEYASGVYRLYGPLQLQGLTGFNHDSAYGQSVGHNQDGQPLFQDDGLC